GGEEGRGEGGEEPKTHGRPPGRRSGGGRRVGRPSRRTSCEPLLLWFGGRDGELLDDLVVAPLSGVVALHGEHEVLRLEAVAVGGESEVARAGGELGFGDAGGHVLAGGPGLV